MMDWSVIVAIIGALGGFELVKYLLNRKTNKRLEQAKAEQEALKTDDDDFAILRKVNEFLQEQLRQKEERFAEQTAIVRKQNEQILSLTSEVTMLKTERALKLCERRGCMERQPQSGY